MGMDPRNQRLGALVLSSSLLAAWATAARARELTFSDRVAAQQAIESIYWSHRIWPEGNPGPKPPLGVVMTDAAIAAKVEAYLRNSDLLETYWHRPLTSSQLQAEIDRMVRDSKAPGTLRELFAALHDDPFLIAECLARPALSRRLVDEALAANPAEHGAVEEALRGLTVDARPLAPPAENYALPAVFGGCSNDLWSISSLTNGTGANHPSARQLHASVWTGAEMIVWGGWNGSSVAYNNGGLYDPATDAWILSSLTTASGSNVPSARYRHTAVWTGTEMIVWGGLSAAGTPLKTGGRYDPATDSWATCSLTTASGANVPAARLLHTAIWTGTQMIVWGGTPDTAANALNNGGRYDLATDSWPVSSLTTATGSHTPSARIEHTAVWSGTEMIIWGGLDAAGAGLDNGGRYDAASDTWVLSILTNATGSFVPTARHDHTAIWTGNDMIIWGGAPNGSSAGVNTGGRFDPAADSWELTSLTNGTGSNVPSARQLHAAIWTGSEMIVWGGSTGATSGFLNTGGRFNPFADSWVLSSLTNATGAHVPSARQFHSLVFTGGSDQRMIVWGGNPNTATGGVYCAVCTRTWYQDSDGDGHGNPAVSIASCTQPAGYVLAGDDCDDTKPAVHPGATEVCDGLDNDCDGTVDNGGGTALCSDGAACSADVCNGAAGCALIHENVNLDTTGFSANRVDGRDLEVFALAWMTCPGNLLYNPAANLDQGAVFPDSCVDISDFHLFMDSFGRTCP